MKKYIPRGVCILLLISSLALLLMPSWLVSGVSVSAADYIINPGNYKELTSAFSGLMGSRKLTTRYALPIFVLLVINSFALAFSLILIRSKGSVLLTSLVGAIGIYVYATNILLKAGAFAVIGLILSVIMVIAGIFIYLRNYK